MRLNFVLTLMALISALLLAYIYYHLLTDGVPVLNTITISGFVTTAICLECGMGISWKDSRHQVNIFIVSMLFLLLFVIEHSCFAIWGKDMSWLIITTGLLSTLYLFIIYVINQIKM